jgi:hypothetical protein
MCEPQPLTSLRASAVLGRKSTLSIESKLLLHEAVLKQCGPMEFSYGEQHPIPTTKSSSDFNPRLTDPF